jgi:hypothetical protein
LFGGNVSRGIVSGGGPSGLSLVVKELPRVQLASGATLQLMVVAADGRHCAGVDLASGALVRGWCRVEADDCGQLYDQLDDPISPSDPSRPYDPIRPHDPIRPYDIVSVVVDDDADSVPDPAEPEAFAMASPPERIGHLRGRRSERLLRPVLHPRGQPLLGISSTVVPFWERSGDHPSIAVVEPEGPVTLWREGPYLACRFAWLDYERELPCLDRDLAARMDRAGRPWMAAPRRCRLVVALTPPIDGRCHIVVEAVLARA